MTKINKKLKGITILRHHIRILGEYVKQLTLFKAESGMKVIRGVRCCWVVGGSSIHCQVVCYGMFL